MKGALEEDIIKELIKLKVSLLSTFECAMTHMAASFQDVQLKIRNSLKGNIKLAEHVSQTFLIRYVAHRPR